MDREKVIETLQYMISENCTETQFNYTDDIEAAIALLKEQEPVKPIMDIDGIYYCGNCGQICVGYEVEFTHNIIKVENYCHKCGRSVKWEQ